jgi:hypothetical protein
VSHGQFHSPALSNNSIKKFNGVTPWADFVDFFHPSQPSPYRVIVGEVHFSWLKVVPVSSVADKGIKVIIAAAKKW